MIYVSWGVWRFICANINTLLCFYVYLCHEQLRCPVRPNSVLKCYLNINIIKNKITRSVLLLRSTTMQEVLANVTNIRFDLEYALEQQLGALPLPFPGMDKSGAAVCDFFIVSTCSKGTACPFRHVKENRTVVCKHWLRGLCKKGDQCEFLHEYDMSKMPECHFYARFTDCSNKDCPFLHIDPESKIKDCPWYDRGFCRHGPSCRHRHTRRVMCINYMSGFCPEGPECKFMHPQFELPSIETGAQQKKSSMVCHYCQEPGHKLIHCPVVPPEIRQQHIHNKPDQSNNVQFLAPPPPRNFQSRTHIRQSQGLQKPGQQSPQQQQDQQQDRTGKLLRPLDQVTCFKCGEKGHYANKCPKGHLAFLSSALQNLEQQSWDHLQDRF